MRVLILGKNGMLSGMLERYLAGSMDIEVIGRDKLSITEDTKQIELELYELPQSDYIINCIGAIKPRFKDVNFLTTNIIVNSVYPHILANYCKHAKTKLIHISTDCVYDGTTGKYNESSLHNPTDEYGKTKSLGEPTSAMVLRTSIIGPEWDGRKASLVEWLLSQNSKNVDGYTNHLWNGLTTLELAKCIKKIIDRGYFAPGVFHLFSDDVTKYHMLEKMADIWQLDVGVNPTVAPIRCDRTLITSKLLNSVVAPISFTKMIKELDPYINV